MGRTFARIFVLGHFLCLEAHSFPRTTLSENCSLRFWELRWRPGTNILAYFSAKRRLLFFYLQNIHQHPFPLIVCRLLSCPPKTPVLVNGSAWHPLSVIKRKKCGLGVEINKRRRQPFFCFCRFQTPFISLLNVLKNLKWCWWNASTLQHDDRCLNNPSNNIYYFFPFSLSNCLLGVRLYVDKQPGWLTKH